VFLGGCGLPQGWRGREACNLLETGFGLGLNFLTTWAAWQADTQRSGRLHFLSVEAFPVAPADLLQAVCALGAEAPEDAALLPRVQALAAELAAAWGALQPGLQTFDFEQGRVRLTLAVGEVEPMLAQLPGPVDAVYLDGFSPALNPAMWSGDTLAAVARLCRPGTRLASWCVAGAVRARLQALGFAVRKAVGLPPKRHRLEAVFRPGA
jgi:tRNA 5-methylaminomethyl-2-thiouridine biosynthesis bifunctional protein